MTEEEASVRVKQRQPTTFAPEQQFYQSYDAAEDKQRTNVHYEQPVDFFYAVTGGRWNVYSCNLYPDDEASSGDAFAQSTLAQEAKLDRMAQLMELKPGARILDVGCGWGGPLVYLCKKYGATGVGLTLSASQKAAALARAEREGVSGSVEIVECHWCDYVGAPGGFDAVYTDEVIVHFHDLGGFFGKAFEQLRPGGMMVNKELHYTLPRYSEMTRGLSLINEIYGSTGNYRALAEELTLANDAGFEVQGAHQMPLGNYKRTMENWVSNMWNARAELEDMVGAEYFKRFRTYLKMCLHIFRGKTMTLDMVVSRKPTADLEASVDAS